MNPKEIITERVLFEVANERLAQDAKWGEQNHPSLPPGSPARHLYGLPHSSLARRRCDEAARGGDLTWGHILVEEVCEAVDAPDLDDLRMELIQSAAVIVAWVESIDRNRH